jgi:hypothetical protein
MRRMKPVLDVRFFCTDAGAEPVREWLKDLPAIDRKTIGEDVKTVQFGWPWACPWSIIWAGISGK